MEIGTNKRIRKALMVEAENFVVRNSKEKVNNVKYRKRPRTLQEREDGRHHENCAIRHENLPNGLSRKHLGHRKPKRIRQRIEQDKHNRLQQKSHRRNQDKRIFEKLFNHHTNTEKFT
jgi:hypothetical protein